MVFQTQSSIAYIKRKDIHKILVMFRLFTNLLRTNLNKKCKLQDEQKNEIAQKKDKNPIK